MPEGDKTKDKINEMRMILGSAILSNDLDKDCILKISQDLDQLITQYYKEAKAEERKKANSIRGF